MKNQTTKTNHPNHVRNRIAMATRLARFISEVFTEVQVNALVDLVDNDTVWKGIADGAGEARVPSSGTRQVALGILLGGAS